MKTIIFPFVFVALLLCSCNNSKTNQVNDPDLQTEMQDSQSASSLMGKLTAEMAYEGVNNYCHSAYDWSAAEDNPDIMCLTMGEETDSATTGTTRMVEKVPSLNVEEEAGTINLFDYLEKQN